MTDPVRPGDPILFNGVFGCVTAVSNQVAFVAVDDGRATGALTLGLAAMLREEFRRIHGKAGPS